MKNRAKMTEGIDAAALLAASKEASWHGAPEGAKLLLVAVEALLDDVKAQGACLRALAAGSGATHTAGASLEAAIPPRACHATPGVGSQMPGHGLLNMQSGRETVPAMMLMMMQKLKAERAMRGESVDGPPPALMELLQRSPLDMSPVERLQGLASVLDGLHNESSSPGKGDGSKGQGQRSEEGRPDSDVHSWMGGDESAFSQAFSIEAKTRPSARRDGVDADATPAPDGHLPDHSAPIHLPPPTLLTVLDARLPAPTLLTVLDAEVLCLLWPRNRLLSGMRTCKHLLHGLGSIKDCTLRPIASLCSAPPPSILESQSALAAAAAFLTRLSSVHLHVSCARGMQMVADVLRTLACGASGQVELDERSDQPEDLREHRGIEWQGLVGVVFCVGKGRSWTVNGMPRRVLDRAAGHDCRLEPLTAILPHFPSLEMLAFSGCAKVRLGLPVAPTCRDRWKPNLGAISHFARATRARARGSFLIAPLYLCGCTLCRRGALLAS